MSDLKNISKNATGAFYVLKRITKIIIKLNLRNSFIRIFSLAFWIFFKIRNNIKIIGKQYVPKKGPYILAGNHSSGADAMLIAAVMSGILGKRFYFIQNANDLKKDDISRYFMILFQGKPRIGTGEELVKWMGDCLLEGKIVVIPPEGMYNKGKIMKGYTGITRIYHYANSHSKSPIPIVPLCSIGADKCYPTNFDENGKYRMKKGGIIGRFGKPIFLKKKDEINADIIRKQTDYIMDRIAKLALQKEGAVDSWILAERERNVPRDYHL